MSHSHNKKRTIASAPLALTLALCLAGATRSAHAATFAVTNAGNAGPGSLRQAILDSNAAAGADVIELALPPSAAPIVIAPADQFLPPVSGPLVLRVTLALTRNAAPPRR